MTAEQVLVLEEAAIDLARGIDFYEFQKNELGVYFFDSLVSDIESLRLSAGVHPIHFGFHTAYEAREYKFLILRWWRAPMKRPAQC